MEVKLRRWEESQKRKYLQNVCYKMRASYSLTAAAKRLCPSMDLKQAII